MRSAAAAAHEEMKTEWDVDAAISTYNVDGWGTGYFTVNGAGNVEVRPLQEKGGSIDILEVVNEARNRGLGFPLVIRFQDLLRHRVESVNCAFQNCDDGVRLQEPVPRRLSDQGQPAARGGRRDRRSRPAVSFRPRSRAASRSWSPRSRCTRTPRASSSATATRTAPSSASRLLGRKLGKTVIIVVEKLEELEQIIRASQGSRRRAADRHSRAPVQQRRGQMGAERRREREVRPRYHQPRGRERDAESGGARALLQARSFPRRLAGAGHRHDQARGARSGALLREALQARA